MQILLYVLLCVLGCVFTFCAFAINNAEHKARKAEQELQETINKTNEQIKQNNKEKEKLDTGNSVADFNNSIDVLSHLKK